jgi:sugar phosphate isomerase/epimerase
MELLLSTGVFDHVNVEKLPELLPLLKKAGFNALEFVDRQDYDNNMLDILRMKSNEYGIRIPNWHLVQYPPLQEDGTINREAIDCMKRSMDKGHRIGAKNHVLHWDHRFIDRNYDAAWREIIDEWTNYAKSLGICLLMETVPDKTTNQRYVPASEIIDFVRSYPPEVLSVCVDVNHSNLQETLTDVVHEVKDRLVSLHISDNDGREEKHWLPGQGVIDYSKLLDSLKTINFTGMFVLEINRWCETPEELENIEWLYDLGDSLLQTGHPQPEVPALY